MTVKANRPPTLTIRLRNKYLSSIFFGCEPVYAVIKQTEKIQY